MCEVCLQGTPTPLGDRARAHRPAVCEVVPLPFLNAWLARVLVSAERLDCLHSWWGSWWGSCWWRVPGGVSLAACPLAACPWWPGGLVGGVPACVCVRACVAGRGPWLQLARGYIGDLKMLACSGSRAFWVQYRRAEAPGGWKKGIQRRGLDWVCDGTGFRQVGEVP